MNILRKIQSLLSNVDKTATEQINLTTPEPSFGEIDLGVSVGDVSPIESLLRLILREAAYDKADEILFSLVDSTETGLRVTYTIKDTKKELLPINGSLWPPIAVVLCNHAALNYYAKGQVKGTFTTKRPNSVWVLQSNDLQKGLILLRTNTAP